MDEKKTGVFKLIAGLKPVDAIALAEYERGMTNEAIPEIIRDVEKRLMLAIDGRQRRLEMPAPSPRINGSKTLKEKCQMSKAIPVDLARKLADDTGRDIMVIVGWDEDSDRMLIVTWGRTPAQKTSAANAGELIEKCLGLDSSKAETYEDFRREGEAARTVDVLRRGISEIHERLAEIVISEGEDAGCILLSSESPTHYDREHECHVYGHPNFSILGDALVRLARFTAELGSEEQVQNSLSQPEVISEQLLQDRARSFLEVAEVALQMAAKALAKAKDEYIKAASTT